MGLDVAGVGSIADLIKTGINKIWPDKTEVEKNKFAEEVQQLMSVVDLAKGQQAINLEEAKSTNWFIAGWRPFIGWTCGAGLCYQFIFMPIANGLIKALLLMLGHDQAANIVVFVSLDIATLVSCLGGLLGLGTLRTFEKYNEVEHKR